MIIVKIGGGKEININGIAKDLSELDEKYIIVHGANHYRDELAQKLGKPKKIITSVSGYSSVFSDEDAIEMIMMSYSGLRNKRIVEAMLKNNINAIGLSGIDGRLISGIRNTGIRVKEGDKLKIIRDFSGKPKKINKSLITLLLDNNYVPVISIPILDENNNAINTENDDVVRILKEELNVGTVINLIEAPGFLGDKNDPSTLIKKISKQELEKKEKQVDGRMKRKMLAIRGFFEKGECVVIISDGRVQNPIKDALSGKGTTIE